jgi:hypothetical protein
MNQSTNTIIMVRPANFGFNPETAGNNAFQVIDDESPEIIKQSALKEFENAVSLLRKKGIDVIVWQDPELPIKTDSIFPNNWFSTHSDGTILTYPMFSKNRRLERNQELIDFLIRNYEVTRDYTMTHYEDEGLYLEGTGSIILDRVNKIAYACASERTSVTLFDKWCVIMNYKGVYFESKDVNGTPIYHTNVMMAIGSDIAVICLATIQNPIEREKVLESLQLSGKNVIDISLEQMNSFAGNMIEVRSLDGTKYLVMSKTAYESLTKKQIDIINKYVIPLPIEIPTIEKYGGGSARCMIAEVFLSKKF